MVAALVQLPPSLPRKDLSIDCGVYGTITFSASHDALLIDLILSPSFQRLKHVLQHGISALVGPLKNQFPVTRFAHCVGACHLVRSLGAGVEEQASALLHDITHLALSHVADKVFGRIVHEEDKDLFFEQHPDIPDIIKRHGFVPEHIFEETNFSLLERDSPKLCGDRVDYGLRDCMNFGLLDLPQARRIFAGLIAFEGEICCRDAAIAREFSDAYLAADALAWSNGTQSALYHYTADAYLAAYQAGSVDRASMWAVRDDEFWRGLVESPLPAVHLAASRVTDTLRAKEIGEEESIHEDEAELRMILKPRVVDPSVVVEGRKVPLSEIDEDFRVKLEKYKASKVGEKRFRINW